MNITIQDLASLLILCEAAGTIVLLVAILILYWKSNKLPFMLPLSGSFLWMLIISAFRIFGHTSVPTWAQWNVIGAFGLGASGLLVLLSRTWPRKNQ